MLKAGDTGYRLISWTTCRKTREEVKGGAPKCHNCGEKQFHPGQPEVQYATVHYIYEQKYSTHYIGELKIVGVGDGEYFYEYQGIDSEGDEAYWTVVDRIDVSFVYESEESARAVMPPDEPIGVEHLKCSGGPRF